jgi:integrating conjugative element membrane protein (TIGR03745 family)
LAVRQATFEQAFVSVVFFEEIFFMTKIRTRGAGDRVSQLRLRALRDAVSRSRGRIGLIAAALLAATLAPSAFAVLPTTVPPAAGAASGDFIALLQGYWKEGVAFLVLAFGAYGFVEVGGGAIAKFSEWRQGKAELSELKWFFVIGVIMLVALVYILTTAGGIIT